MSASVPFEFVIPMKLPSVANLRLHWRAKAKLVKNQRGETAWHMCSAQISSGWIPAPPWLVTLTRVASRKLDSDNLASAFKAVRDEIAARLGVDDGDESKVTWQYAQERGPYVVSTWQDAQEKRPYAVRVRIENRSCETET